MFYIFTHTTKYLTLNKENGPNIHIHLFSLKSYILELIVKIAEEGNNYYLSYSLQSKVTLNMNLKRQLW